MKNFAGKTVAALALTVTLMLGLMPAAAFADGVEEISEPAAVSETVSDIRSVSEVSNTETISNAASVSDSSAENADEGNNVNEAASNSVNSVENAAEGNNVNEAASNSENSVENAAEGNNASEAASDSVNQAENAAAVSAAASSAGSSAPALPEEPKAPSAPAEPDLTGLSAKEANLLIQAYNEEVDRYNAELETYNAAMDDYLQAVEDYNRSAESFNAQAEIFNAEADEHNAAENELVAASDARMADYDQKMASYNKTAGAIARVDAAHTAQIAEQEAVLGDIGRVTKETLSELGTVLTEDLYAQNGPFNSLVGKEGDLVIYWKDLVPTGSHSTILIDQGESSGNTYKVANLHIFEDFTSFDDMYAFQDMAGADAFIRSADLIDAIVIPAAMLERIVVIEYDVVEADANDTVTANTQAALFNYNSTLLTNRYLDGYTAGAYWIHSSEYIGTAADTDMDWSNGGMIFSYENGATDGLGARDTLNVTQYQYFARYAQPTMPEKPEQYIPNLIEHMDMMHLLSANSSSLSSIARMDLLPIPQNKPAPDPAPWVPTPKPAVKPQPEPETEPEVEIPEEAVPMAAPEALPETAEVAEVTENIVPLLVIHDVEDIADETVPMGAPHAGWALINLLSLIATVIAAVCMLLTIRRKSEDSEDRISKLLGIIPAVGAVELFILTENLLNPMVLTDRWTVLMLLILAVELVLAAVTRREREENQS